MQIAGKARKAWVALAFPLTILVAGWLAYSNTFEVPFLFDDHVRIVDEPAIRTVWPPWQAMQNSNRPLAQYTFALNYWWDGYDVVGYHIVNLSIHLATALLLFGSIRRTLLQTDSRYREHAALIAFACALVWVVHPLTTQAVTYIVQRLESLMGLAYVATLYCFIRAQQSRFGWLWSLASIAACGLGMGCKEVMATAPLAVLWYDRAFVASSWRDIVRKRWGYYLALAATWGVLAWSMLHYTVDYTGGALLNVEGLTPWTYLLTQSTVILHYLRLAFWPDAQCAYYAWPIANSLSDVALPFAVMSGLWLLTVWAAYRYPRCGFLAGCFFLILAPTSSIIPIKDLAFEHRMYLPLMAIIVLVFVTLYAALRQLLTSSARTGICFVSCVLLLASGLGMATFQRNQVYQSDISLWTDTVHKSPRNVKVWVGLGGMLAKQDKLAEAARCFTAALAVEPDNAKANAVYAGLLLQQGQYAEAKQHLEKALAKDPQDRDAIVNMGHYLSTAGKYAEAQAYLEAGVKTFPDDEELQTALIVNLSYLGLGEEALQLSETNLKRRPNSARAHTDLAAVLLMHGRKEAAGRHCQQALALDESLARAHATYAIVLAEQDLSAAIKHMARALELEPASTEYQLAMGNLQMSRQPSAAVKYYQAALAASPDNIEALLRLAMAHDASGAPEQGLPYMERVTQLMPDFVEAREMVKAMRYKIGVGK